MHNLPMMLEASERPAIPTMSEELGRRPVISGSRSCLYKVVQLWKNLLMSCCGLGTDEDDETSCRDERKLPERYRIHSSLQRSRGAQVAVCASTLRVWQLCGELVRLVRCLVKMRCIYGGEQVDKTIRAIVLEKQVGPIFAAFQRKMPAIMLLILAVEKQVHAIKRGRIRESRARLEFLLYCANFVTNTGAKQLMTSIKMLPSYSAPQVSGRKSAFTGRDTLYLLSADVEMEGTALSGYS